MPEFLAEEIAEVLLRKILDSFFFPDLPKGSNPTLTAVFNRSRSGLAGGLRGCYAPNGRLVALRRQSLGPWAEKRREAATLVRGGRWNRL